LSSAELREEFDACEALAEKLARLPRTFEEWQRADAEQADADAATAATEAAEAAARVAAEHKAARGQLSGYRRDRHVRLPGDPDYASSSSSSSSSAARPSAFSRVSGTALFVGGGGTRSNFDARSQGNWVPEGVAARPQGASQRRARNFYLLRKLRSSYSRP
jgi:hypothetical protein